LNSKRFTTPRRLRQRLPLRSYALQLRNCFG
jgi:hypothetical protein